MRATQPENRFDAAFKEGYYRQAGGGQDGAHGVIAKRTVGLKSTAKRVGAKSSSKRVGPKSNYKRVGRKRVVAKADGLTKFQRFRRRQAHKGMKLLRIWVPDPKGPGFAAEAARQAELLRGRPEEQEALDFIEAAFEWPEA